MKKKISFKKTSSIYVLFVIATVIALGIIYKNPNGNIAYNYVVSYMILLITFILFTVSKIIMKMRNIKVCDIKERVFKFFAVFVFTFTLNTIILYFMKNSLTSVYVGGLASLVLATLVSLFDLSIRKNIN
jgi:uncharacterized membrane protein